MQPATGARPRDRRLDPPDWSPTARTGWAERAARLLVLVNLALPPATWSGC